MNKSFDFLCRELIKPGPPPNWSFPRLLLRKFYVSTRPLTLRLCILGLFLYYARGTDRLTCLSQPFLCFARLSFNHIPFSRLAGAEAEALLPLSSEHEGLLFRFFTFFLLATA